MWKASPLFIAIILLEIFVSNYRHKKVYTWKETVTNFYLSFANAGLDLLIRGAYLIALVFFYRFHFVTITNPVLYWCCLLVLLDFQFYWLHRMEHFCRIFWAVHVTHHSSEHMNVTVAFRSSVLQPLYRFIFFIPITLFGFEPLDILLLYSLTQFWSIFIHTELIGKLGWMEYIFVTPSHHRVHHASNAVYLDRNLGMVLIIWDRMFGTFQPELPEKEYQPIKYGLTKPLENKNAFNIIFHEWINIWKDISRKDISLKTRIRYLFMPPGWSHDGSRKTSMQIRMTEVNEQSTQPEAEGKKENRDYRFHLPASANLDNTK